MSTKFGRLLKDANLLQRFETDLRDYLAQDYEVEDELVKFVVGSIKEVKDKKQLAAEFAETFEDAAADVATWCWDKVAGLPQQPSAGQADQAERIGLLDDLSEEGELAAEQPEDQPQEEQHPSKRSKREPIKFNLADAAADTAPVKASTHRTQQLRPNPATEANPATDGRTADLQQQLKQQQQEPRSKPSKHEASRGAAAAVKGALAAAVRSAAADGRSSRDPPAAAASAGPRGRGRHREQTPPAETTTAATSSPRLQAAQGIGQDKQPANSSRSAAAQREPPARVAGAKRSLREGAVAGGARAIASRAFQQIGAVAGNRPDRAAKRHLQQQQQEQQPQETASQQDEPIANKQQKQQEPLPQQQKHQPGQQRSGRVSVLDRLGSKDGQEDTEKAISKHSVFERLSGLPPGALETKALIDGPAETAAADCAVGRARQKAVPAAKQKQQEQQPQHQGVAGTADDKGSRRSVVYRLEGAGSGATEQQQQLDQQQQRPPEQPIAITAAAVQQPTADTGARVQAAPPAGTKRKASAAANSNGSSGDPVAAGASKKPATAAAPGAKSQQSAELAALRAKLAAKEAEVKRLQQLKALQEQQQQVDERSVVVFNIAPHVPEAVVKAHFSGCGPLKRCTLLPGRMPGPNTPGAYLEFESNTGALAAMGLAGSFMLDQQIQVARKSDYKASQQKAKQSYAALRAQAGAAAGKNWIKPVAVPNTAATVSAGAAGGGEPESPTSLGSMGLAE